MAAPASSYPAVLARVIFGAALFGLLVVVHLHLQARVEFAAGCSGLADLGAASGADAGCGTVTSSSYANFLGVSNIVWGFLFYALVAALRFGYAATRQDRLRLASFGVVGVGFLYTLYLVYLQVAVIGTFCFLCMASAATVTLLLALHVAEHLRLRQAAPEAVPSRRTPPARPRLAPYMAIAGVFALLAVADVALAGRGGPDAQAAGRDGLPTLGTNVSEVCAFDSEIDPIADFDQFLAYPSKGADDAAVRIVEVFDPNCPHCRDLYGTMQGVAEANSERARIHYVPFALREASLGQIVALNLAAEQGRYFEMMEAMFRRLDGTWGMTIDEITATAEEAGMDGPAVRALLLDQERSRPLIERALVQRQAVMDAFATRDGSISVPKIAIEGRVVAATRTSYTPACMDQFIAEAAEARASATQ